jgi:hypothetical protein
MAAEQDRQGRELLITIKFLSGAIVSGAIFIAMRFVLAYAHDFNKFTFTGDVFVALLWAVAWFAAAFLLGFLFGIPKVLQKPDGHSQTGGKNGPAAVSNSGSLPSIIPYQLRVNTNLEEISDWLTKILVGATLTQLVKIPAKLGEAASFMSESMSTAGTKSFAAAIIVFFSSLGFLAGYIVTRMFFTGAFLRSDPQLTPKEITDLNNVRNTLDPGSSADPAAVSAAHRANNVEITDSISSPVASALTTAALLTGDAPRALQAARIAVEKSPDDPQAHLNYAIALYENEADSSEVEKELKLARELVNRKLSTSIKEDVYNSIVYFYLYVQPPEGFTKAIEYGEEFLKISAPSTSALWMNLACAYAQKYIYLESDPASEGQLAALKKLAFDAIKQALKLEPSAIARFRELAKGEPDPQDNDLEVFMDDPEFRKLLDL